MAAGGKTMESTPSLPNELPLDFLKKITNDFSDKMELGTGAFGTTYKGILEDGRAIAVKRLGENSPVPRDKVFANEVQNIMGLEHDNIVKLVAYCREAQNKLVQSGNRYIIAEITETLLCYEYLPKGSLDKHIFGEESTTMDWNTRFKIIKGICKGIQFLHKFPKLLHLALKPQNILLDDNMVPKIADFGFSRMFGQDHTRMNTRSQVGTVGYMAPEYIYHGEISTRSDIYSLGLIILEITTRQKNSTSTDQRHARDYIDGVMTTWMNNPEQVNLEQVMSEYDDLDSDGISQVENCIKIGLKCVEIKQETRPTIDDIVTWLH